MVSAQEKNYAVDEVATERYQDQKPGTSGLRKKVSVILENKFYLENFIQSIFNAVDLSDSPSLVLGGDGRYYNDKAIQVILKIAAANNISKVIVAKDGLMSTPAISHMVRLLNKDKVECVGAILLTASHNPGGPDGDFGVKFNCENGGPAPEAVTSEIYEETTSIKKFRIVTSLPEIDIK